MRKLRILASVMLLVFAGVFIVLYANDFGKQKQKIPSEGEYWLYCALTSQREGAFAVTTFGGHKETYNIEQCYGMALGQNAWLKLTEAPVPDRPLSVIQCKVCATSAQARARNIIDAMSDEALLAQMLLVRVPAVNQLKTVREYQFGGYLLFYRDIRGETAGTLSAKIQSWQDASDTGMFIAVDEEGGTVVRVSYNKNLRSSRFKSPQALYAAGGIDAIVADAAEKDELLLSLGFNLNLAPVCDVAKDRSAYIYDRTLGQSYETTAQYIAAVVTQMNADGIGSALKHFPGYGENADTHYVVSSDYTTIEEFLQNDLKPFIAGIEAGANCVLVSHNTVYALDPDAPASLSWAVHDFLRTELGYDGIIMTDDVQMGAIYRFCGDRDPAVAAILAGNDLVCCSDYPEHMTALREAFEDGTITRERVEESVMRLLLWKMELGII